MKQFKAISLSLLVLFLFNGKIYSQVNLEKGLLAYYSFNGNPNDETKNSFDPIVVDGPKLSTDCSNRIDSAYLFDGANDYMEIENHDELNFSNNSTFTIALWAKLPKNQVDLQGGVNDLISKWDGQEKNPYPYNIRIFNKNHEDNGKIWAGQFDTYFCGNNPSVTSKVKVNDDMWHHIIFMKNDKLELKLFIDGVLQGTETSGVQCETSNGSNIRFGIRLKSIEWNRAFAGSMDEIRFYNRALTDDEIEALFSKTMINSNSDISHKELAVFPNPITKDKAKLTISTELEVERVEIYDSSARMLLTSNDSKEIDLQSLNSGVYFLQIYIKGGKTIAKKIYKAQ